MTEVCQYFGRLYGMSNEKVNDRIEYLVDLLDLKTCKGQLNNFSGGQKRRVSFIVALLHEPEILILDEPTVGVDPILRAKIWSHIRNLADHYRTTVILTTHYIEEMRRAERVGIMRGGKLMAEASPAILMEYHNTTMLEDVVLKYCLQSNQKDDRTAKYASQPRRNTTSFEQDYNSRTNYSETISEDTLNIKHTQNIFQLEISQKPPYFDHKENMTTSQLNRIWALTRKNLVVLQRNIGFLLFVFLLPALIVVFFALAIGHAPNNIGLGFVNDEIDGGICLGTHPIECSANKLSCSYLDILQSFDVFKLHNYKTKEDAVSDVEEKSVWGYIHFSKNFSRNVFDRTLGKHFTNETIYGSKLTVRLDMSSVSIGIAIKKLVYDAYRQFSLNLLMTCGVDITGRDLPVEFEEPIFGADDNKYTSYVVVGVVIGFLPFISCVSCALSYIIEKKDGMLDRTKVAGVTAFDIMISHAIPQLGIVLIQSVVVFVIMYLFNVPFDIGSPLLAFILTVLASITGMTMGFTASEIFDEEKNAMLFAMAFIFPSFLLSGLLWPLEGLPASLKIVSYFLPETLAAESLRSILFRGWNLMHFTVYIGFLSQVGFIVMFIFLTYIVHIIRK